MLGLISAIMKAALCMAIVDAVCRYMEECDEDQ